MPSECAAKPGYGSNPALSPALADELYQLWFGDLDATGLPSPEHRKRWFVSDPAFDARLAARFGAAVKSAIAGSLEAEASDQRGRLAMLLLLDQLPRNLFRGTARAFAGDARALESSRRLVDSRRDLEHAPIERVFVYLPFEHSERLEDQQRSVALFEGLVAGSTPEARETFEGYLHYARAHRECIERFGRFPHRNDLLGRANTEDERRYLAEGGGFA